MSESDHSIEMKGRSGRLPGNGSLRFVSVSVEGLSALYIVCGATDVFMTSGGCFLASPLPTLCGDGAAKVVAVAGGSGDGEMSGDSEKGSGDAGVDTCDATGAWNDGVPLAEAALVLGVGGGSCAALGGNSENTNAEVGEQLERKTCSSVGRNAVV